MRALVVGSGAREHALALALARTVDVVVQRPEAERCPFVGPVPGGQRIEASSEPPEAIEADLVVVGPEEPLVDGLADRLRALGRLVLGPGAAGAVLEGSKAAMKRLLAEAKVPTARFGVFDDLAEAKAFLRELPGPFVVKTDGLAAGKGVLVTEDPAEAEADLAAKLAGAAFGDAGRTVVVEEGLRGREVSLMVLTDGTRVVPLPPARDAKRLLDGDQGPNTGGMGAYSPVPDFDHRTQDQVLDQIVEPILAALRRRAVDYRGVLYVGLMLTADGPMVLELNVRLGDPEAQVVLPRVPEDLAGLFAEAASGRLRSDPRPSPDAAVGVVLAAPGYPRAPETGGVLEGLEEATALPGVSVLHGATARADDGRVRATGGRVLTLVGQGPDLGQARARAYEALAAVHLPGGRWRTDVARLEEVPAQ